MEISALERQNILLQNRERIFSEMKKYPNVLHVGVGGKEINNKLTDILCYRIYVSQKKAPDLLREHEKIPSTIDGFITDVLVYGEVQAAVDPDKKKVMDDKPYRPLKGGVQIKNDLYTDVTTRGGGTLGCLVLMDDGSGKIVGLTCQHVVAYNTEDTNPEISNRIGQPWRHICCCCFEKNMIGSVLDSAKDNTKDCAIIEFNDDILEEIKKSGAVNEIFEIGNIKGTIVAFKGLEVKKRGAATQLSTGTVADVAFENNQVLIAPSGDYKVFADLGDSGSVVVDKENRVVGLLWGIKRDRLRNPDQAATLPLNDEPLDPRICAVVTPIAVVEAAMHIKVPVAPAVIPTISVHSSDAKTFEVPSSLPAAQHPKKHFVTIKGDGDIVLSVSFDQTVDPHRIGWVSDDPLLMPIIFPGPSGDNSTATIRRSMLTGAKAMVSVTVDGLGVGDQAGVWVIWCIAAPPRKQDDPVINILPGGTSVSQTFDIRFLIQPAIIVSEDMDHDDLPDLRGVNHTPPPNVPTTDTDVYNKGEDLSSGAIAKWDVSVRLRCRGSHPGIFVTGGFNDMLPNYPSLDTVGNFDTIALSIYGTPYLTNGLSEASSMYDTVTIPYFADRTLGVVGDTMSTKIHIQHFARLELNGQWYVVSDTYLRRVHIILQKRSELDSHTDYDEDGHLSGDDWIKTSYLTDDTNNDF